MIRPILEYASAIWSPYTQRNINLVEVVQRRSVRFIFNNYSPYANVTEMLERIDFKTLAERRNESRLTVVSRAAKKLQSARPIKRRAATTVSYLRVGPVSQY